MPTELYPFPFYKGRLWIDNSTFDDWRECPRQYEYSAILKRTNIFSRAALNYGKGIHAALATLEFTCGNSYTKADRSAIDRVLDRHFDENPQPPDDHRTAGLAKETLRRYISLYEQEPWTILEYEGHPIIERVAWKEIMAWRGIPVMFFCLLDLGVRKPDGIWAVDHKTTSMLGSNFDYEMRVTGQLKGYLWMFKQCFGEYPTGYIINAIRSLSPGASAMKTTDTLNKWWGEQFRRLPFYTEVDKIDEWHETFLYSIESMLRQFERNWLPINDKSCVSKYGRCQYYDICTLPFPQRKVALQSNNFEQNNWVEKTIGDKIQ